MVSENEFSVLEVVKTNLDVEKASFDIYEALSFQFVDVFETIQILKFEESAILTSTYWMPKFDASSKTAFRLVVGRNQKKTISTKKKKNTKHSKIFKFSSKTLKIRQKTTKNYHFCLFWNHFRKPFSVFASTWVFCRMLGDMCLLGDSIIFCPALDLNVRISNYKNDKKDIKIRKIIRFL